ALTLQVELHALAAAFLANGISGSAHDFSNRSYRSCESIRTQRSMFLDPALLRGPAAVVRERSHVLDCLDDQAGLLQGGDRRLAAGAGALQLDLDLLEAKLRGLAGRFFRGALGGERRALAAPLEADRAGRGVTERVALRVSDRDNRVVERRLNVRDP